MAPETQAGNSPANSGGDNTNKGAGRNSRRRPLRSKRRGRKADEGSEARNESRSEPRGETRGEGRGPRVPHSAPKPVEKNVRENRERRRRRRMRSKQRGPNESAPQVVEDFFKDLPPLVPAFVYTHVLRPAMRDNFEFRTEHFSKVTRKMEDFHIDLSPLYPDGGDEMKGVAYMPPLADSAEFAGEFARAAARASEGDFDIADYEDDYGGGDDAGRDDTANGDAESEGDIARVRARQDERREPAETDNSALEMAGEEAIFDDLDWDAEESLDAARLDGGHLQGVAGAVIADDFYEDLDDSVVDEYPDEDIDA